MPDITATLGSFTEGCADTCTTQIFILTKHALKVILNALNTLLVIFMDEECKQSVKPVNCYLTTCSKHIMKYIETF